MGLKAIVEDLDSVDERYRDLYTERDGKFELTGVEGLKTQADIDRVNEALRKERNDHRQVKERLALLGDRKIEEVLVSLDRIPELEAAAAGGKTPEQLEQLVQARLRTHTAPLERDLTQTRTKLGEYEKAIEGFQTKERTRAVHDSVRAAAAAGNVVKEAMEDVLLLAERVFEVDEDGRVTARDGVGVTPGIDAAVWLTEMQAKRPHWWPPSAGGGAPGGKGGGNGGAVNPWSAAGWNMTEQVRIYRENPQRAEQMAKSAGTRIGGQRPQAK